jgi:LmbE family N-acetylglucosaminyl deacetylase
MKQLLVDKNFGSMMIIVPHQDDEILMSAGLLYELNKTGNRVDIVMVTNGDYECTDHSKGENRLLETVRGLKMLGIERDHLTVLGYADTGMPAEDSFITHLYDEKDVNKVYPSDCGSETYGVDGNSDYHMIKTGKHASYNRLNFKSDIKSVIAEKRPDHILTTSEFDEHGDHAALYKFLVEILDELKADGYNPSLYCGLIHSCDGDENWPDQTPHFSCPKKLEQTSTLKWDERLVFTMPEGLRTENGEKNLKLLALSEYEIALEPNAVEFLMSFIKDEEFFWKLR